LFCTLDADDFIFPTRTIKSVRAWQKAPKFIGLVYTDAIIYDERDDTSVREYRHAYSRELLEIENCISNIALFSKMALGYSGLYDENIMPCEDWDLWLRITENFIAIHIPEALHQYTVTGQNCTFSMPSEDWQRGWAQVREKMIQRKKLRNDK